MKHILAFGGKLLFVVYLSVSIFGSAIYWNTDTDVTNWCRINYALYEEIETEDVERTRDVYRYANSFLFWNLRSYIHLLFTEAVLIDCLYSFLPNIYRECLKLIPHSKFSFAKIWLLAAQFEIRQLNLAGARQILGNAIGKAPKDKVSLKFVWTLYVSF